MAGQLRQIAVDEQVYETVRRAAAAEGRLLKTVVARAVRTAYPDPDEQPQHDGVESPEQCGGAS